MRLMVALALGFGLALAPAAASPAAAATSRVYVVHGIPGVTVDVAVNGAVPAPLSQFMFKEIEAFDLEEGPYEIVVYLAGTMTAAIGPVVVDVPGGRNLSLTAHLDEDGVPVLTAFENVWAPVGDEAVRLGVRHAAHAPAVDVVVSGDVPAGAPGNVLLPGVPNGAGAALDVAAIPYAVWLRVSDGKSRRPVLRPVNLKVPAGEAYYIFAVGSVADGTFQYLVQANP